MKHPFYAPYSLCIGYMFLASKYIWEKIRKQFIPYFALHFQHFFLTYQCPAGCFIVPTSWQPLPYTLHLTSTHSIPVPALFRAPIVIQKGGFVTRRFTVRQVTLMLHSKMYGQSLCLAQSSGRSCSITFLCVSVQPSLNVCSHVHKWWWSEFKHLHLALLKFQKGISCPPQLHDCSA